MTDGRIKWDKPIEAVHNETGMVKPAKYLCWENGDVAAIEIDGRTMTSLPHGYVDYYWRIRNVEGLVEEPEPVQPPAKVSTNAALLALGRLAFAGMSSEQISEHINRAIEASGQKLRVEVDDDVLGANFGLSRAVDRIVYGKD